MDYNNSINPDHRFFFDSNGIPIPPDDTLPLENHAHAEGAAQKAIAEVAESTKRPIDNIGEAKQLSKRLKRGYSDDQIRKMLEGKKAGKTPHEIGLEVGITGKRVSDWLRNNPSKIEGKPKKPLDRKNKFTEAENLIITEGRQSEPPESYKVIAAKIFEQLGVSVNEAQVRYQWNKFLSNEKEHYFRFTGEQDGIIAKLINDGFKYDEIAKDLKPTPEQITAGMTRFTSSQVGNRWINYLAPKNPTITYRFTLKTADFTKEIDERIKKLKSESKNNVEIGRELNMSVKRIRTRLKFLEKQSS